MPKEHGRWEQLITFKHGHELTRAIQSLFATGPADLAVAYWGGDACAKLTLPSDLTGFRVACDAHSGFCSHLALKQLLERGATVVDVPMLHAKVYRTETAMVVASANASSRGLSLDELVDHGLEAGILDTDTSRLADAKDWFDEVFASGRTVSTPDLPAIEAAWNRQRASRMLRITLVDAILQASASLRDRKLRVYVYTAAVPSRAVQSAYKKTPYYDPARWNADEGYPFFWGEMPGSVVRYDELLCFELEGGKARSEGVWRILDKIGAGDDAIWPAQLELMPFGRSLGATDELDRRVMAAVREGRLTINGDPIALDEFAALISDAVIENDHLARMQSAEARAAYAHVLERTKELGLATSYNTGAVPAVKLHDVTHARRATSELRPSIQHLHARFCAKMPCPATLLQLCHYRPFQLQAVALTGAQPCRMMG